MSFFFFFKIYNYRTLCKRSAASDLGLQCLHLCHTKTLVLFKLTLFILDTCKGIHRQCSKGTADIVEKVAFDQVVPCLLKH